MASEFSELHDELRSVAGDLLAKERATGVEVAWPLLAQAGWTGLEIPDDIGGAGATFAEVAVILIELGRAASTNAYLGGVTLAVGALTALVPSGIRDELLTDIADGSVRLAVALSSDHETTAAGAPFTVTAGWQLTGRSDFVPDAVGADRLLVLADGPDGSPVLVAVPSSALTVTAQPVLDETRRLATVTADAVEIDQSWVLGWAGDPAAGVRALLDRATVAIACDSLGLAEAMLSATVAYTGMRQQFGRPIGSFQAVKHMCADMLVQISVARQLVGAAVEAVAEGGLDSSVAASMAASMAKAYACDTAVSVVGTAMQLHGGIGYTWESGVHVYLKRAALNRSLFGSPAAHRKQLAQRYR
jgi:alkylation response protein AidB-like acyl-CoA dehydrogenase